MNRVDQGTLKCVIAQGTIEAVLAALPERVGTENIREVRPGAVLVHTALEPAELRDWLSAQVGDGGSLLVFEFEKWSGFGGDVDSEWLLARGH